MKLIYHIKIYMVHKQYITSITANTTLNYGYDTYLVNASGGGFTITLPTILADGMFYLLRRTDFSTNTVTVNCSSGQLINGVASIIIPPNADTSIDAYNFGWYAPGPVSRSTYFTAYRGYTGNTGSITIPSTAAGPTGLLVPFIYQGPSFTPSGSWILTPTLYNGVTGSVLSVPITGRYLIDYVVFFFNSAGTTTYNTCSTCVVTGTTGTIPSTIIPGGGATIEVPGTHIEPLTGMTILNLNATDVIAVKIIGNSTATTIIGNSSLFATDSTSTSLTLTLL